MAKEVAELELRAKADSVISEMNKVTAATSAFSKQLQDILKYLDDINKKSLSNINKQINNTVQNRNIANQNIGNNYDFGNHKKAVKNSNGSVMVSDTGREKAFKDYEQAVIDETIAIRKDIEERTKLRQKRLNAENVRNQNTAAAVAKREDRNSAAFIADRRMIAEAKLLNAKNNQVGAEYRNPRFQAARALDTIGDKVSSIGVGSDKIEGKVVGNVLSTVGAFLKSPWAGTATAVAKLTESIVDLSRAAIESYSEIEATKTQLGVVFSNQTQADSMFGQISQYAVKSPFGVQQTSELAILLKQSGVYASDLMDTLRMLGDTAGGNMEKMKRIANNYAQIMAIGKASMLDMRQFAYAGIPIFEAVSKELKVSQQELRKLISDGKVTADIVEKVFKDLTGVNGIFENATAKGAKTLKARLQNLSDAKQLAMASVGEWGTNIGSYSGNDGYVNKIVTGLENIYSHLHEHVNTVNLENDVKEIKNREHDISSLRELIEYNKRKGNDTTLLEKQLEIKLKEKEDSWEKDIATLTNEYRALTNGRDKFSDYELSRSIEDVTAEWQELIKQNKSLSLNYWANHNLESIKATTVRGGVFAGAADLMAGTPWRLAYGLGGGAAAPGSEQALLQQSNDLRMEELSVLFDIINNSEKLTDEMRRANNISETLDSQSLSADTTNSFAKKTDSLTSQFQELSSIFKNSEEEKLKSEEEHIKVLKEAQKTMKELLKYADDKGNISLSKMSISQALEYNKKGAFVAEKINLHPKTGKEEAESANLLKANMSWAIPQIVSSLGMTMNGGAAAKKIQEFYDELNNETSDSGYIDKYLQNFTKINKELEKLGKKSNELKGLTENLKSALGLTQNKLSFDPTGKDVTENSLLTGGNIGIPLWKRILSQYTGLTTQGMTGTAQTLDNYTNDMAIRNRAAEVLKATFSSLGPEIAQSLMNTTGSSMKLKYDVNGSGVFQVDWKEVQENLHNFATQLSSSTNVISAYKSGLEAELEVYNQLFAAGFTQGESADLSKQKTISEKKFRQLAKDAGEQLVNAFGEGLVTKEGQKVKFENDKFFDEKGNEIQVKELQVTGNLFELIKKELPEIRNKIGQASVAEENNKALAAILGNVKATMLSTGLLQSQGVSQATGFAVLNPAYTTSLYNFNMAAVKTKYDGLKGMSEDDILIAANSGNKEAEAAIKEVFEIIANGAKALVDSDAFKELERQTREQKKKDALNGRILKMNEKDEIDPLDPTKYGGKRGLRNFAASALGFGREYDREDLLVAAARTGNIKKNYDRNGSPIGGSNIYGVDATKFENMGDDEVLNSLDEMTKKTILWQDSLLQVKDTMKDMGESLIQSLEKAGQGAFLAPFEALGASLVDSDKAVEDLHANIKQVAADLLKNVGSAMATAGFQIAGMAALNNNWGLVAAGLALAAAGGFASGLGGALSPDNDKNDKSTEDKTKKLEDLRDSLVDLLAQAREDALYYETTLRHKKALAANGEIGSNIKVNDAIIAPNGNVISTAPDDYLIATKTPHTLIGSGHGGAPVINFSVIDKSTGVKVTQQRSKYNEETNTIDFEAIIESKITEVIASSKGDEAFAAREARLRGRHVLM